MNANEPVAEVVIVDPEHAPPRPMARAGGRSIRLIDERLGAKTLDLHLNVLQPGSRADAPYHLHTNAENIYVVLQGRVGLRLEDRDIFAQAGQTVFIPPNIPHAVWNDGDDEVRLLEIYAPPGADFVRLDQPSG